MLLFLRAYAAYEENTPIDPVLEHQERLNIEEYTKKFSTLSIRDPSTIPQKEWIGEKDGIHRWPKTYFMDISRYFSQVLGNDNLWQRLECEYKEGKAYRYYTDGFLGELFITFPQQNPNICILKSKCVPSQRVSMKQYDVWVIIQKEGQILGGYCTCTAGLLGKQLFFISTFYIFFSDCVFIECFECYFCELHCRIAVKFFSSFSLICLKR